MDNFKVITVLLLLAAVALVSGDHEGEEWRPVASFDGRQARLADAATMASKFGNNPTQYCAGCRCCNKNRSTCFDTKCCTVAVCGDMGACITLALSCGCDKCSR